MTDTPTSVPQTAYLAGRDDPVPTGWERSRQIGARSGVHVVFDPAVHDVGVVIGRDRATEEVFAVLGYTELHGDGRVSLRVRDRGGDPVREATERLGRLRSSSSGAGLAR